MENDTVQPVILARPRQVVPSRQLRNLRNLLLRENVDFVIVVGGAKTLRVGVEYVGGDADTKTFSVGGNPPRVGDGVGGNGQGTPLSKDGADEGCFVLMHLSDNPERVGVGFFDLVPTLEVEL